MSEPSGRPVSDGKSSMLSPVTPQVCDDVLKAKQIPEQSGRAGFVCETTRENKEQEVVYLHWHVVGICSGRDFL